MLKKTLIGILFVATSASVFAEFDAVTPYLKTDYKEPKIEQNQKLSSQTKTEEVKNIVKNEEAIKSEVVSNETTNDIPKVNAELSPQVKLDNESIRLTFKDFVSSVNTKNFKKLKENTTEHFIIISSSQELLNDKKTIEEYFPQIIGENQKFERTELSFDSGITVEVSSENWATIYGKGLEKYKLNNVEYSIPIRITATVVKEQNDWKIQSLHMGANFINNEIISAYEDLGTKFLIVGLLVGLLVSSILSVIILRKK